MSKKNICPGCLQDMKTTKLNGCGKYPNNPTGNRPVTCPDYVLMTETQVEWLREDRERSTITPIDPTETVEMDLNEYAAWARMMWLTPSLKQRDFSIMSLGLAEEAGEVVGVLKKFIRDGNLDKLKLKKELGDVLYYWVMLCNYFDIDPQEVLSINVEKIESRQRRGTLQGSGDDR